MTRAISIGWPSFIGKCRSILLRYSPLISDRSDWHNGNTLGSRIGLINQSKHITLLTNQEQKHSIVTA